MRDRSLFVKLLATLCTGTVTATICADELGKALFTLDVSAVKRLIKKQPKSVEQERKLTYSLQAVIGCRDVEPKEVRF